MVQHVSRNNLTSKFFEEQASSLELLADEAQEVRSGLFRSFKDTFTAGSE